MRRVPELIIFADAHHEKIPFSMEAIHEELERRGYHPVDIFSDYGKMSALASFQAAAGFMRLYAQAKYVFICDNFLPAASCRKNRETKVIQLWHSCGLLKKMGYDTGEDVPKHYIGSVYKNYDLVTVSAPCCVGPLTGGMRQPPGIVQPLGVSRTDLYFHKSWVLDCKKAFYDKYPDTRGKKIILWAPTFRGNAADPHQAGLTAIELLKQTLGSEFKVIRKVHPYLEGKYHLSNCDIPTERLLPVTDLMITDYSSVVFDYILFNRPFVLYAPDLCEYEKERGFYIDYTALSPYTVTEGECLAAAVLKALEAPEHRWLQKCRDFHVSACDGRATERILKNIGL